MLARFWQIVYTATQFPVAPRVRILIEGQQRESMGGEGVVIDRPIERPAAPPRF
jgi:spore germination protein GerM